MLPQPLHPAVVHFPLVLMFLLPLFAAGALWLIRRGASPGRAWSVPLLLSAALAASALVALRTGAGEEERVEAAVSEPALHAHEEAAERFLVLSGGLLVVAAIGLWGGRVGSAARLLATAGAVGLIAMGVQVGAAGGKLVYEHNAASVYATNGAVGATAARIENQEGRRRAEREKDD